ncbi:MAG: 4-hydroxy-tetrahydrodipicolinate reductase, partial [Victivallales bacterium]|nr:4-hydroxy-tetrahydrodipicolinate reductase [Victivallales bacterium]
MIKVAVIGAAGRMGRMLVTRVIEDPELKLVGALEYSESPFLGMDAGLLAGKPAAKVLITADPDEAIKDADCTVDFSAPGSTMTVAKKAAAKGIAMVIGTTGLVDEQKAALKKLADNGARIVFSPNMSVGVNLLFALCEKVGKLLGTDYDIEI